MKHRSLIRFLLEGIEGAAVLAATVCTWPLSKRWVANWGAHREERERAWPGDLYASGHAAATTRAIGISAPVETVWPWLVQFGLGRAGFYSYELLERIVGIPVTNLESVEPTMQSIAVGDVVRLHPRAPGIPVVHVEPERHICFGVLEAQGAEVSRSDPSRSWSMYLEPTADGSCRLLVRGCVDPLPRQTWGKRLAAAVEQPIDFVMEQRMLRTIKRLAERAHGGHGTSPGNRRFVE